jgi:hypothetical protein
LTLSQPWLAFYFSVEGSLPNVYNWHIFRGKVAS